MTKYLHQKNNQTCEEDLYLIDGIVQFFNNVFFVLVFATIIVVCTVISDTSPSSLF